MDDFYAARGWIIPPLPWQVFAPPLSLAGRALMKEILTLVQLQQ